MDISLLRPKRTSKDSTLKPHAQVKDVKNRIRGKSQRGHEPSTVPEDNLWYDLVLYK